MVQGKKEQWRGEGCEEAKEIAEQKQRERKTNKNEEVKMLERYELSSVTEMQDFRKKLKMVIFIQGAAMGVSSWNVMKSLAQKSRISARYQIIPT